MKKLYYHFTTKTLRDGRRLPKKGTWLVHDGPVVPCNSGLHASEHPFDALRYCPQAEGLKLHLVELGGEIIEHGNPVDKVVASRRKIVKTIEADPLLRLSARMFALRVADKLPKSTDPVVLKWLKNGDERIRSAAWSAARSAAESAAWSAAESAARSAARSAAWIAAESAAWSAAESAARSAAWIAAWSAACSAACSAAWIAAESAAESAARSAARSAAGSEQVKLFKKLVDKAFKEAK